MLGKEKEVGEDRVSGQELQSVVQALSDKRGEITSNPFGGEARLFT